MKLRSIKDLLKNIGSNRHYYISLNITDQNLLLKRINKASETAYQHDNLDLIHRLRVERDELEHVIDLMTFHGITRIK